MYRKLKYAKLFLQKIKKSSANECHYIRKIKPKSKFASAFHFFYIKEWCPVATSFNEFFFMLFFLKNEIKFQNASLVGKSP